MKKTVTDKKNITFLIALFFEVLAMLISITTIPYMVDTDSCNLFLKLLRYTGYAIILFKILNDDYTTKQITIILVIVAILLMNSVAVKGNTILCLFLFIIGMRGIDFNLVCKVTLVWYLFGITITVLGSQCRLIENWDYTSGERVRRALGYFYPSHATSTMFYTMCLFCYVMGEKLRLWHVCILEALNLMQYKETDARAGTLLMVVMPIVFWMIRLDKKQISNRLYGKALTLAFPVCAIFSIGVSKFYTGKGLLSTINSLISNRFALANKALNEYGLSLFGQRIEWVGNGGYGHTFTEFVTPYNYVDCSYVKIMLDYGIIFLLVVIIGYTIASVKALKENDKFLLIALSFIAIYSIIEPRLIEIGFNSFVLVLVVLVNYRYDRNKVEDRRNESTK